MGPQSCTKESISHNVDQLWNHMGTCDKRGFLVSTSSLQHQTSWRLWAWGHTIRTTPRWCFYTRSLRTRVWDGGSQPRLHVWTAWTQWWCQIGPRNVASMDLSIHLPKAWRIQRWEKASITQVKNFKKHRRSGAPSVREGEPGTEAGENHMLEHHNFIWGTDTKAEALELIFRNITQRRN